MNQMNWLSQWGPSIFMVTAIWIAVIYNNNKRLDDFRDFFKDLLRSEISGLRAEIVASETRLSTEIAASESRIQADLTRLDARVDRPENTGWSGPRTPSRRVARAYQISESGIPLTSASARERIWVLPISATSRPAK